MKVAADRIRDDDGEVTRVAGFSGPFCLGFTREKTGMTRQAKQGRVRQNGAGEKSCKK